jgi:DNA-binding GntR family transcriptional regulator
VPKNEEGERALQLVRQTISGRIDSGEWKPGHIVRQSKLGTELTVSPHFMRIVVGELAEAGWLRYEGAGYSRQAVVAATVTRPSQPSP